MEIDIKDNFHRALIDAEYTSKIFKGIFDKLNLQAFNTIKPLKKKNKSKRITKNA